MPKVSVYVNRRRLTATALALGFALARRTLDTLVDDSSRTAWIFSLWWGRRGCGQWCHCWCWSRFGRCCCRWRGHRCIGGSRHITRRWCGRCWGCWRGHRRVWRCWHLTRWRCFRRRHGGRCWWLRRGHLGDSRATKHKGGGKSQYFHGATPWSTAQEGAGKRKTLR